MNELTDKYLKTLDRSPRTIATYRWALNYYIDLVGDDHSDGNYETFLWLIRSLAPSTKRVLRSAVMGFYKFHGVGSADKRMDLNEHYSRTIKTKPVNLNRDKVEKIISFCDTLRGDLIQLRDRAFVLTLADSGFRISELCALTRGDIDWQERRAVITGKGDKTAVVRFSDRSLSALDDYLKERQKIDGESGKALEFLPLFIQHGNTKKIKAMSIDGMRQAIKKRMKQAGARVRIHDFRHYFVTMIVLATEGNLKLAQVLARHESSATTQRYAHYATSELDKQYDEIFNR